MDDTHRPHKKVKLQCENANQQNVVMTGSIKSVLSKEYTNEPQLKKFYVGTLIKKQISSVIENLNASLPNTEFQYLKRVKGNHILLFPQEDMVAFVKNFDFSNDQNCNPFKETADKQLKEGIPDISNTNEEDSSVEDVFKWYMYEKGLKEQLIETLCENVTLIEVAAAAPKLRWQYDIANKIWPCKFHPNKELEKLFANENFSSIERDFHIKTMSICNLLSLKENKVCGICVDPRSKRIVAVASGRTDLSPVLHCAMVLVDLVARTQNGGIWKLDECFESNHNNLNLSGIMKKYHSFITNHFDDVSFGAEIVDTNNPRIPVEEASTLSNLEKYGPYLCTGYDVYLSKEPCLMCAMALVHSRVKRIFYMQNADNGALETRTMLHTIDNLNHHFEVFNIDIDKK